MATSEGMSGGFGDNKGLWTDSGQDDGSQQRPTMGRRAKMDLTKEEMDALQQCSRESFYYRCVPLALLFMGSTQILVNKQFLKGHPRLGAIPKNMFAGLIAYLLGKISYQGECRRKIMALPNSPLGDAMRQGKRGRELMTDLSMGSASGGFAGQGVEQVDDEVSNTGLKETYLESGTQEVGLDDNNRPTVDSVADPAKEMTGKAHVTYDELRKQNRAAHEPKIDPSNAGSLTQRPGQQASQRQFSSSQSGPRVKTNKYGDVVED